MIIRWFVRSLVRSFVGSFVRSFVRSCVRACVRSFIQVASAVLAAWLANPLYCPCRLIDRWWNPYYTHFSEQCHIMSHLVPSARIQPEGETSHMKGVGMLVGNFELNP